MAAPSLIDLHTHSTASDGTVAPSALMAAAREVGLRVVALTDHDTTDGWSAAAEALPSGLTLVRGAEISCTAGGVSLHLLGYLFDPSYQPLAEALEALRESRVRRAETMVAALLADGVPVTWEQVRALAGGAVGRPHVGQALVASGVVGSLAEAFSGEWIGTGGRYWTPKLELDAAEAISLVAQAGGVTVFAHPGAASRGRIVSDEVISDLAAAGLGGLEVSHQDHTSQMREHLQGLAGDSGWWTPGEATSTGPTSASGWVRM